MALFAIPRPDPRTSDLEQALSNGLPLRGRLKAVQVEYAKAAALLGWLAEHPSRSTAEDGRAISRRLRSLRKLIEIELRELHELGRPDLDLHSPAVEQVIGLLLQTFEDAACSVLPPDQARQLMEETRKRTQGWQDIE